VLKHAATRSYWVSSRSRSSCVDRVEKWGEVAVDYDLTSALKLPRVAAGTDAASCGAHESRGDAGRAGGEADEEAVAASDLLSAVLAEVVFRRFVCVIAGLIVMAGSGVRVMRRPFVVTGLVIVGCLLMVACGVVIVLRCGTVMLCCFFGHVSIPRGRVSHSTGGAQGQRGESHEESGCIRAAGSSEPGWTDRSFATLR
jgi:hypothetical protein